jgi:hypothetical protein
MAQRMKNQNYSFPWFFYFRFYFSIDFLFVLATIENLYVALGLINV